MKRRRKAIAARAPAGREDRGFPDVPGRPWFGLYAGDGTHGSCYAPDEGSMLVIGPPRSGKTSCIVVPAVLDAPAAVVSTSTKSDVLEATLLRRWTVGNCFVFDPTGTMAIPERAYRLRWSPVVGCDTFDKAVAMARALSSAARPGSAFSESAHWVERAEGLLAPLLFTANLAGRDMTTVCRWVISRDVREPLAVLERSGHEMAKVVLGGVLATEERERSGIFSTAAGLLSTYRSDAALATTKEPNFDPAAFAHSTDAVYICAPSHAQEQLAPIVVALLEQIRDAVYARPAIAAPVVFALDEVASIAPLPSLPAMAAEGGGQGLRLLACLQDLSQARARWGEEADGFFSLFNQKLIFPGVGDQRTLNLVSALGGDQRVETKSLYLERNVNPFSSFKPRAKGLTVSSEWRPRLPVDEVAKGRPGHALAISGSDVSYAGMIRWFEHTVWSEVARADGSIFGEAVRPELRRGSEPTTAKPAPNGAAYEGPTIYSDASLRSASFTWIANGLLDPEHQFAQPRALQRPPPESLELEQWRMSRADRVIESFRAEALDLDNYDPLTDEAPEWEPGVARSTFRRPIKNGPHADNDDVAEIEDRDSRRIEVRVLGPVEVLGWRHAPERPILTEIVCYLALHRDRAISGDALRAALRPDESDKEQSAKTLRTYLSLLRKAIGPEALPMANSEGYRLAGEVTTDWELFRQRSQAVDLETKLSALGLVRGRPFQGVANDGYAWVFAEFWLSDIEIEVAARTKDIAGMCLELDRTKDALEVLRQGLMLARTDFSLWDMYLSCASEVGSSAARLAQREARAALGADAPNSDG
jgi:hypothetical protein